jgi:hypothetical protein
MSENESNGCGCLPLILAFIVGYAVAEEEFGGNLQNKSEVKHNNVEQRAQADSGYYQTESQNEQYDSSVCVIKGISGD